LILVNFDKAGVEYLFPNEVVAQGPEVSENLAAA
jgi:hypothetical protein